MGDGLRAVEHDVVGFPAAKPQGRVALAYVVLALCGIVDGFELHSTGMIAQQLASEFGLKAHQLGQIFALTALGLAIGSSVGGLLADMNAKLSLVASMTLVALCSMLTALTQELLAFAFLRFVTAVGMGAIMPLVFYSVLSIGPAASAPRRIALCGAVAPSGGLILGGAVALFGNDLNWRTILIAGGVAMLLTGVLAARFVPPIVNRAPKARGGVQLSLLFARGRATTTLCIWLLYLLVYGMLYVQTSWFPVLLNTLSLTPREVGSAMVCWSAGGIFGGLVLGAKLRRATAIPLLIAAFGGVAMSAMLLGLGSASVISLSVGTGLIGFFTAGGIHIINGLAPSLYPQPVRGLGMGLSLAVGRLGAAVGPFAVGFILGGGSGASTIFAGMIPAAALILLMAVSLLPSREPSPHEEAT